MSVEKGNWLGKNQKEVDAKLVNITASGDVKGFSEVAVKTTTLDITKPVIIGRGAATLPDGTFAGQTVRLVKQAGTGSFVVTGDFTSTNNTLTIAAGSGAELIWVDNDGTGSDTEAWMVCGSVDGTGLALSVV